VPALQLNLKRLSSLLGSELSADEAAELAAALGMSVEEVSEESVKVEYNPNRPDFSHIVGVARAMKGLLGLETGAPRYKAAPAKITTRVEASVRKMRPYIACAVVRGLRLEEYHLEELINAQEDLHWVVGRDRRRVAIGLHDLSKVVPPFTYKAVGLDEIRFIPLGEYSEMSPREILSKHPKGRQYSWILEGKERAPVILDSRKRVLSFPPIINSSLTELTPGERDIFIDVTGTDEKSVNNALNILVTTMIDMGGRAECCDVIYSWTGRRDRTPDLRYSVWRVRPASVNNLLGVDLQPREICKQLRKMRLDASVKRGAIEVCVPPYRVDILHEVDLVEEVAIGLGYQNLQPEFPKTFGFGGLLKSTAILSSIRRLVLSLGATEVVNTTLSNSERDYKMMLMDGGPSVKILNPVSALYDSVRERILPSLLSNLAANTDNPYPQRLFEIGDVVLRDDSLPERTRRETHLALVTCHPTASYSEIKSLADEILRHLGKDLVFNPMEQPFFIPGRSVSIMLGDLEVGYAGEIHPAVLENFGIPMPAAALELNLSQILDQG
jgi:phenylalanyl-tRNA synthetase beta chain